MKNKTDNPNLPLNIGTAQEQASQDSPKTKRSPKRKGRRKSVRSIRSSRAFSRDDSESRWNRIKGRFAAKIGQQEPDELREVLLGLGVAVGVAGAVVILVKTLPLAVTVLALLGLALTLKLWQQIRFLPRPF